ncbi:Ferric siderophore transport system, periplasmic binding protein TonB [Labilithrix luteola]|uniref:Ferric siderophore transport system, periplasmic binding protein TonB n=1 Tax=Labilithrix luteola TaxID=1391654 RepID=A0A0K1Q7U7_9BACT|nr:energy transducer TonB [Labilithrix luteola]AKV01485.1 Ferric siderophore transport system, periplasmic binding protein TonB [Labilithrix luteola]
MTKGSLLYLVSFGAHGVLALGVATLKGTRPSENVSVAVIETTKKPATPPAPPPPPPPALKEEPRRAETKAKVAPSKPAPAAAEPPPAAAAAPAPLGQGDATPDFGLSMAGGTGGGLAVPTGGGRPSPASSASSPVTKKVLAPAAPVAEACAEPAVKAKALTLSQPAFTREAREANVSGKVRVEVTVDANGHVTSARVLEGLGYGLDEAALAAARAATFEPSTRCGKPVASTFVIGMRFSL